VNLKAFLVLLPLLVMQQVSAESGMIPRPDHVIVVIIENKSFSDVIGNSMAPYINSLAKQGAVLTNSSGVTHPSMPNYMALFAGATLVSGNQCSARFKNKPNLGSELIAAGFTFTGYAEALPSIGFQGCSAKGGYAAQHNAWVHFTNLPPETNQPFTNFPTDFSTLPTVAFIEPAYTARKISISDNFLQQNLSAYVTWAQSHNSLLIITCDEGSSGNHIPTLFIGPMVVPGEYNEKINHYNVLRALEDMYGLAPLGKSATTNPITDIWTQPAPVSSALRATEDRDF
jgi:hypothetical protein